MAQDGMRDQKNDGRHQDPNAGRRTPGHQERPMSEEEALDTASNDSMDASDPPSITQPGRGEPVPSSGASQPSCEVVKEALGGVQGDGAESVSPSADGPSADAQAVAGRQEDEPAPDAGEIEWAGGFIKKAPTPQGS